MHKSGSFRKKRVMDICTIHLMNLKYNENQIDEFANIQCSN